MSELKPCPNPECPQSHPEYQPFDGWVECLACGTGGPSPDVGFSGEIKPEAIRLWNLLPRTVICEGWTHCIHPDRCPDGCRSSEIVAKAELAGEQPRAGE